MFVIFQMRIVCCAFITGEILLDTHPSNHVTVRCLIVKKRRVRSPALAADFPGRSPPPLLAADSPGWSLPPLLPAD